jgi:hypothetical protein
MTPGSQALIGSRVLHPFATTTGANGQCPHIDYAIALTNELAAFFVRRTKLRYPSGVLCGAHAPLLSQYEDQAVEFSYEIPPVLWTPQEKRK